MYSHNMVGTNDLAKSKTFYDALFTAIGGKEAIQDDKGRLIYMDKRLCDRKPGAGGCLARSWRRGWWHRN